jgi:hypothetical protein
MQDEPRIEIVGVSAMCMVALALFTLGECVGAVATLLAQVLISR